MKKAIICSLTLLITSSYIMGMYKNDMQRRQKETLAANNAAHKAMQRNQRVPNNIASKVSPAMTMRVQEHNLNQQNPQRKRK